MSSTPETTTIDTRPDNEKYPDVMIDLETTGLNKERNAILQIAGVKFNLVERTISDQFFNMSLDIPKNRFWDEDTRNWWLKDKRKILEDIIFNGQHPKKVLDAFELWAMGGRRMWSKPTHFDYSFLESYFVDFEIINPFHFRTAENMNSWIRARYWPMKAPNWESEIPFDGPAHNALFDCFHQLKVLFKVADDTKVVEVNPEPTGDIIES